MAAQEELDLAITMAGAPVLAPRGGPINTLELGKPLYPHYDMAFTARTLKNPMTVVGLSLCDPSILVYHHIGSRSGPLHSFSYLELTNRIGSGDFSVSDKGNYVCRLRQSKEVGGKKLRRPVWVSYSIIDIGEGEPQAYDVPIVNLGGMPPCIQLFCGNLKLHDVWEEDENG